jgi:hypothetical protein
MILGNYTCELKELEQLSISLNRTLIGSPGTEKTTVAQLYGLFLADLGLLSNRGEVIAAIINTKLTLLQSSQRTLLTSLGTTSEHLKAIPKLPLPAQSEKP